MLIYEHKIESNFDAVATVVRAACAEMDERLGIEQSILFKIDFMLREMLNNAAEHGNEFAKDKFIRLRVEYVEPLLTFYISDEGAGIFLDEEYFSDECHLILDDRNRGYAIVKKLNFDIEIDHNTVIISMKLTRRDMVQKQKNDSEVKLILENDITANHVEEFNQAIEKYLADESDMAELTLDLSQTKNIDSVGISFVVALYKKMKDEGILFKITGASSDVKSLFKLMKLDQLFNLED